MDVMKQQISKDEAMRIAKQLIMMQGAVGRAQTPEEAKAMAQSLLARYLQGTATASPGGSGSGSSCSSNNASLRSRTPRTPAPASPKPTAAAATSAFANAYPVNPASRGPSGATPISPLSPIPGFSSPAGYSSRNIAIATPASCLPSTPCSVAKRASSGPQAPELQLPRTVKRKQVAGLVPLKTPTYTYTPPTFAPATPASPAVETSAEKLLYGAVHGAAAGPPAYAGHAKPVVQAVSAPPKAAAAPPVSAAPKSPAVADTAKAVTGSPRTVGGKKRRGLPRRNPVEDELCEQLFIQCCESIYLGTD
eukprot:TRINITY_DN3566_c0_g4_i1.p2 TRINITY_DN3566_c0_g4~~TRINITY_DN3566_c0_g4_i1.p2  ORF type:complete len:358 (+),score=65.64 TRINITY_DN3566_c0_g4_i1:156-1076(+)